MLPRLALVSLVAVMTAAPVAAQSASASPRAGRAIVYHPRDIVPLRARVHYTTLIVLPEGEDVVEVTCGDKEVWLVNVRAGLVSVKPAKPGSATNLNLVTTSGRVYAFLLSEISSDKTEDTDLTVYLELEPGLPFLPGPSDLPDRRASRKFVPAEQLEDFRAQAELAREQAKRAADEATSTIEQSRRDLDAQLTAFQRNVPLALAFDYLFKPNTRPFFVQAIFHDGRRTFIKSRARELPAVYEFKDGLPNLVNFEVQQGTYVIPKVLDDGYLMIGKERINFRRVDGGVR